MIPSTDGSTQNNSTDPLKPQNDSDAEGQPRNTIVGEPSVAEKMSWVPQNPANVAGASKTQASPDLPGINLVLSAKPEPSVNSLIPRSVSAVSRRENQEESREIVGESQTNL